MDVESCESRIDVYFESCWRMLDSVEPEFSLEPRYFSDDSDEGAELRRSTLTGCLSASPMIFSDDGELRATDPFEDQGEPKRRDTQMFDSWLDAVVSAQNSYLGHDPLYERLFAILEGSGYATFSLLSDGRVIATKQVGENLEAVKPDNESEWAKLMGDAEIVFAANMPPNATLSGDPSIGTAQSTFYVAILPDRSDMLPACNPDYSELECGACDTLAAAERLVRVYWVSKSVEPADLDESSGSSGNEQEDSQGAWLRCIEDGIERIRSGNLGEAH